MGILPNPAKASGSILFTDPLDGSTTDILSFPRDSEEMRDLRGRRMDKIVSARKQFHEHIPADLAELIERYDAERFTPSASLMDNVLFGRIAYQQADASDRIRGIMPEKPRPTMAMRGTADICAAALALAEKSP